MRLSCAANELIVIEDAFYGQREEGPHCGCMLKSCDQCEKSTTANELIVIEDAFYGQREEGPHCGCMLKSCDQCEKSTTAEKKESVTFGGEGKGLGQFRTLGGLTLSSTNKIFVTDTKNKRIQVFSMKGDFIRSFSTGNRKPFAVSTGRNDTLWVILEGARIHQYRKDGHATGTECSYTGIRGIAWHKVSDRIILTSSKKFMWLSPTDTPTQGTPSCTCNMKMFGSMGLDPLYVTVDKSGNIYITVWRGSRILKYDKNGVYVSSFGSKGSGAGNFYYPQGICVDSLGRVIVADAGNGRVEMFTAEGRHICTVAYINQPAHVATGREGQLVVSNQQNFVTIFPKY
ncbi:hypothetical protein Bbelb_304350 [Branchiostoma belcheri]|nr:hypothetical protein Bbelb_304350 [Branchiostoma belcheri]